MTNINQKVKLPGTETLSKQIALSREIVNPKRDWRILLILLLVFIIFAAWFDFYVYQQIVSGDMYVSVKRDELVTEQLKVNDLKNIFNHYKNEKDNVLNIKMVNLVDPSI